MSGDMLASVERKAMNMAKKQEQPELIVDASESQIQVVQPQPIVRAAPTDPASMILAMIDKASEHGLTAETMGKFMDLYDRAKRDAAKEQYNTAYSAFKAECPPVQRRTENPQFKVTRDGRTENRRFASLEDIEATVREPLGRHGLSFQWSDAKVDSGMLTLHCVVRHVGGHSESSAVSLPIDSKAGCSEQQKYGIVMTYAQRYSLIQALGLTSCDEDEDGNEPTGETITEDQAANLIALMDEVGVPRDTFLKWAKVGSVSDLPKSRHKEAVTRLEAKRGAK